MSLTQLKQELKLNETVLQIFAVEDLIIELEHQKQNNLTPNDMCRMNSAGPALNQNPVFWANKTNPSGHPSAMISGINKSTFANNVDAFKASVTTFSAPLVDARTATKLVGDLGMTGKIAQKSINGRQYILFKGYAGTRKIFTGTKYLASNKKVVQMAVGKAGVKNTVKGGGILTIVLCVGFDILQYFLDDQATMATLIGTLAADLVKVGISNIIATAAGLLAGVVTTIAVGPILVAIGVGIVASLTLDFVDKRWGLTDRLVAALEEAGNSISQKVEETQTTFARKLHQFEREFIYHMSGGFDIDNPLNFLGR